jgi:hypothetical protein
VLEPVDQRRLLRLVEHVKTTGVKQVLEDAVGLDLHNEDIAIILAECVFDHGAILVFPDDISDVVNILHDVGFDVCTPVPSVVVRERIARRYDMLEGQLEVNIIHGSLRGGSSSTKGVEVFCLPRSQVSSALIMRERCENNESHFALLVERPNSTILSLLRSIMCEKLSLHASGGGYNSQHGVGTGGRSVLYFDSPQHKRLELVCAGHFPDIVEAHLRDVQDARHRLLTILSQHWAMRAVYTAAKLGIADFLAENSLSANELARLLNADADAMARFLRYLCRVGVVRLDLSSGQADLPGYHQPRYRLDAVGELLQQSSLFRDLTLLYGEEFYRAWDNFPNAILSGTSAFETTFGVDHFDYFTNHPEVAEKFNRSMSAVGRAVADQIRLAYDFSSSSSIVDIGGGDGTLLQAVLKANTSADGILFELPHVCENVVIEPDMETTGRLTTFAGDFFEDIPGGKDVYILSRVLHDWNDKDCARILQVCYGACTPTSTVLIAERLLVDDAASLAAAWDMQMLAITGGRERTSAEYQALLTKSGFDLVSVRELTLDLNLLVCRPTAYTSQAS